MKNTNTILFVLLSIVSVAILMYIYRNLKHDKPSHIKIDKNGSMLAPKHKMKCCGSNSEHCLDKFNLQSCACHHKEKSKIKELFTMAQSVFPLHAPTIPAHSQILNENMSTLSNSFMEMTDASPFTREHPSIETTTGLLTSIPPAEFISHSEDPRFH
jgi:hypothetical protein